MSTTGSWFPQAVAHPGGAPVDRDQDLPLWRLVVSLVPVIGLLWGVLAFTRGERLAGTLMVAVGTASAIILQTYWLALH